MIEENVVLVDKNDKFIGLMPKMEAHQKGLLHRAFSVFIFNDKNEIMLQKRALNKYHSPGLWTNTCCSHPRNNESIISAGLRRLNDEMGFQTDLKELFNFIYKKSFENGLVEYEFDYVLIGSYNNSPKLNLIEAEDWKWMSLDEIKKDVEANPNNYTAWLKIIINDFFEKFKFLL
ncbi:MAG: isopentenyl-diphosphate Delta-isomerase [Flavobacteriaceae bacterium]|nr:isopentenyl-diphosphate Delta-isomerase [Flavobacteriaceae bacterium]